MGDRDRPLDEGSGSSAGEVEVSPGPRQQPQQPPPPGGRPEVAGQAGMGMLAATPPPEPSRRFGDDPRVGMFSDEQRQRVQSAVAFHLGGKLPGVEWTSAVQPIADRFLDMAGENPRLVGALEADVNTLFALSDMEIAEKVMRGEPVSQFGDVFDAIAEVSWEIGATDLASRLEADRVDAVKGTFESLTFDEARQLTIPDAADVETLDQATGDVAKAREVQTLFDVPGAWSFSPTSGILAVSVGAETIGVEARPGFDPDSHLDVMAEVVAAQADGRIVGGEITGDQGPGVVERVTRRAHEVGGWLEENPTRRRFVDGLWKGFQNVDAFGIVDQDLGEAEEELAAESDGMKERAIRQASMVPFPEDAMIAAVARQFVATAHDDDVDLSSQDALAMAASMVDEDRDQFVAEFESLTQEELIEELEGQVEGQSPLGRAVESSLGAVLDRFEAWDHFTQTIGVNMVDAWWDITEGQFELVQGEWEEGFSRLSDVFEAPEASTAADYFDLDGTAADAANLAVGIGFDPINWIFPGARGVRAIARRALTNPKFAPLYLKMGSIPKAAQQIAGSTRRAGVKLADDVVELNATLPPGSTLDEVAAVHGRSSPEYAAAQAVEEAGGTIGAPTVDLFAELRGKAPKVGRGQLDENSAVGIRNVAAMSGLDDTEIIDLVKIAMNPESTVDDVNEVLTRAMHKDWIGEGPARAIRHSTVEGIGRTLESVAAGKISTEHLDTIMKMVSKLTVSRSVRLGENQALDNIADLLTQFFPADKDKFASWFLEAVERRAAAGDDLAMAGVNQMTKEAARRSIWETGGTVRSIQGADDLRTVNQNLRSIETALTQVDELGVDDAARAAVREQLERMHSVMARRVDEAQPKMTAAKEKRRLAHKQLKQATYLEADSAANAARNEMAGVIYEIYDDVAREINEQAGAEVIPAIKGASNPLAPHVPVRDWEAVTGVGRKLFAGEDEDLALMMGLSVDDANMARQADAVGMFNRSQHVTLPASPYEVILYQKVGRNPKVQRIIRNNLMKKLGRGYKLMFAFNLLVNPLTAGKITLDETARFFADTGDYVKFLRATLGGIPGLGRASETAVNMYRNSRFGEAISNPYALSYRRNVGGFSADDFSDYGWVQRPTRKTQLADYREQAERWVNGTLLQDRRFREYARWLDEATVLDDGTKIPPKDFVDWWDNGGGLGRPGSADTRATSVTIRDEVVMGTEMSATDAFNVIDKVFDHWVEMVVDAPVRNQMRRTLLQSAKGARGGLDVTADARLLNSISQVPGLETNSGSLSTVFNIFFGAPAGRRSGVFYEYYFDEAMEILTKRHAGRIITVDMLMNEHGVSRQTAQHWLKQGADVAPVAKLVSEAGMRTEAQLGARAATYAERRADDLMYRFTSASLAGRGVESGLMFPFARAQVDFLSWWADHLTKPMMVRLSPETRAKLPQAVNKLIQGVERQPVNLRAMAKYAHIAAAMNNDEPSVIDQTIDSLTFFPTKFDSEFLMDVMPQFGPLPAWMFDIMVDKGVIDEEAEANMEALFPALGFTEAGSDDVFDYALPNSRRSIRDATVGTARWVTALFGEDIHTNPGKLGELANIIADGQKPAATGDFQTAMAADYLAENIWDVKPGSDAFNRAVAELAVKGAVEANRQEWGQDLADRVFPLAGYDKEYRALRAYEGFFSEDTFATMEAAGLFQQNDLLEVDGKPRIQKVWDDYQSGTADEEDLEWLADRLTTAYFDAGRVEVLPGFSYMDFLHLKHPQVAVNLISKSEDSGIPVRSDEHAEFKQNHVNQLTGRLQNIPPGDTGRDMIADARRRGWITSRPVEEWLFDAAAADHKSGQRAVRGVWEWVSHRTWQQGTKQSMEDKTFTLDEKSALVLNLAGLEVESGTQFTYGDFHQLLDDFDERFDVAQPLLINTLERGAVHGQLAEHPDEFGLGLIEDIGEADREFDKLGLESVEDWPDESKQVVRDRFAEAINLGYTTLADYRQEIEPIFGPLDYEPPTPPAVDDLETGIRMSGDELGDVEVIDGDTLSVLLDDGPMRVRLIGINAPEVTQGGYAEARDQLAAVVQDASEVTIGVYKPELFGMTQLSAPGERRLLAWLYVDGVPLYDPDVFTADNPRGAGVGGNVVDLQAILEANR